MSEGAIEGRSSKPRDRRGRGSGARRADELHLGGDYAFLRSSPLAALRLGVWLDPDHRLRYRGDDPYSAALLQAGDDELHFAAGFGLAFESFQIDLGADFSDLSDTVSLSAIYSFY